MAAVRRRFKFAAKMSLFYEIYGKNHIFWAYFGAIFATFGLESLT